MNKFGIPDTIVQSGEQCNTKKTLQFLISFNGNSISSIYLDTKSLYKYELLFYLKTSSLIIIWVPYKHTVPERLSSQSDIIWNQRTLKIPNFQIFSKLEKIWKYRLGLDARKTQLSAIFLDWEKLWRLMKATFQNSKIPLWLGKNWKLETITNILISQFWICGRTGLCLNLSFTVENKIFNFRT